MVAAKVPPMTIRNPGVLRKIEKSDPVAIAGDNGDADRQAGQGSKIHVFGSPSTRIFRARSHFGAAATNFQPRLLTLR